jgi:alkylation response protein AidB-like acyl-CoA dehydrogenase
MAVSSGSTLLESADGLAAVIRANSGYGDQHGQLAPEVVDAFHDARLFGMWVPQELGGSELDPLAALALVESVSSSDASSGWVLMGASLATGTAGAYLSDSAAEEIFGGERFPILAGQGTRPGTAKPVDGGFLLSGSWSFASGVKHATHVNTLGIIEGTGEPRLFVVPVEQVALVENWDVLGLRGTGSIDYIIDEVFVPEDFSYFAAVEEPLRGGAGGRLGVMGTALLGHSGWALGVARRMLDELIESLQEKAGRPGAQAGSDSLHEQFATAEATLRSARAFVFETWGDAWETLNERGDPLSIRQKTLTRLALTNATWSAQKVGSFVYFAGGTNALRAGAIQRFFRDLHAGTQHIASAPPVIRHAGRELAGLAEGQQWFFVDLVDMQH